MGERLRSQKSYVCSFFDCKAKFNKSWKLEAHLCKHTGLVSGFNLFYSWSVNVGDYVSNVSPNLRNRSPARAVIRAFALAINSPDMSSITVGKSRTSKPFCSFFLFPGNVNINLGVSQAAFQLLTCSGLQVSGWWMPRGLCHKYQHEEPHGSGSPEAGEAISSTIILKIFLLPF